MGHYFLDTHYNNCDLGSRSTRRMCTRGRCTTVMNVTMSETLNAISGFTWRANISALGKGSRKKSYFFYWPGH